MCRLSYLSWRSVQMGRLKWINLNFNYADFRNVISSCLFSSFSPLWFAVKCPIKRRAAHSQWNRSLIRHWESTLFFNSTQNHTQTKQNGKKLWTARCFLHCIKNINRCSDSFWNWAELCPIRVADKAMEWSVMEKTRKIGSLHSDVSTRFWQIIVLIFPLIFEDSSWSISDFFFLRVMFLSMKSKVVLKIIHHFQPVMANYLLVSVLPVLVTILLSSGIWVGVSDWSLIFDIWPLIFDLWSHSYEPASLRSTSSLTWADRRAARRIIITDVRYLFAHFPI